ncbi:MAG: glycosyltransferase family 39 protein [Bacteroidales bacterium]|nr:glycosyltransferase family 39 protein [Bacteroidales bacterium]
MLDYFPRIPANRAITLYFIVLLVVSVFFYNYAMLLHWVLFGAVAVLVFFVFGPRLTYTWRDKPEKEFVRKLFLSALVLRVAFVVFSYYFFNAMTGMPFEYAAADSMGYNNEASWIVDLIRHNMLHRYFEYIEKKNGVSDMGYPFFLGIQYLATNKSIFLARVVKALLSAYTCVLAYKLAARNFGQDTGRIAAVFTMLMPNLIMYCGLHLKETELVFISMAFLERTDYLLRSRSYAVHNIIAAFLFAGLLFLFRTALGIVAVFSLITAIFIASEKAIKKGRRVLIGFWIVLTIGVFAGGTIAMEVEELWKNKDTNQRVRLEDRAKKGNVFARYAGASIFAPMIFTLPFPTMVETPNQETFRMLHGGVFVKNIMSFFTLLALLLLLVRKQWRDHVLILSFLTSYLAILTFSAFAHSERFHVPAIPLEMVLAAYGVVQLENRHKVWINLWMVFMFIALVAWTWFKLAGRGVI